MNNEEREIINKTKELIDELKSISENNGIGNSPSEYKIITEVFLYKFLNDKFLYEIKKVDLLPCCFTIISGELPITSNSP